jgi:hypothetical protein
MKKIRIALLLAALGFFCLMIYQNMGYLSAPAGLQINLWIAGSFHSDRIINAQLILGAFFIGVLFSYFWGLSCRFKNNQTIKSLNDTLNSQEVTIADMKNQLSQYQGATPQQYPILPEVSVENA